MSSSGPPSFVHGRKNKVLLGKLRNVGQQFIFQYHCANMFDPHPRAQCSVDSVEKRHRVWQWQRRKHFCEAKRQKQCTKIWPTRQTLKVFVLHFHSRCSQESSLAFVKAQRTRVLPGAFGFVLSKYTHLCYKHRRSTIRSPLQSQFLANKVAIETTSHTTQHTGVKQNALRFMQKNTQPSQTYPWVRSYQTRPKNRCG